MSTAYVCVLVILRLDSFAVRWIDGSFDARKFVHDNTQCDIFIRDSQLDMRAYYSAATIALAQALKCKALYLTAREVRARAHTVAHTA